VIVRLCARQDEVLYNLEVVLHKKSLPDDAED
jgi:hypothetical protein